VQLHRELPAIRALGAELVLIGNGNRRFAEAFKHDLGITAPLYVDTKRLAYRALEMKRGVLRTLGSLETWKSLGRALKGGFRQKGVQGDAWQLGGVLVVLPGGSVAYRYLSESAGDHPAVADILRALPAVT
jgi:AhpC/TSA antioxidant enzyme